MDAMRSVLTMILAGGAGERLYPLTRHRAKPAVPFGGVYRIIDFTLSNCINSDLRCIHVVPQYKYNSLMRHIRTAWNIVSRPLGEFIDIIPPQMRVNQSWYLGTADAVYQNLYSIDQVDPEEVLILSADHIYKMDYRKMLYFHRRCEADMTVASIEVPLAEASRFGILRADDRARVTGFQEKPLAPSCTPGHPHTALASMGIYIFRAEVLRELCMADAANPESSHDFGKDIIPMMIDSKRVYTYAFEDENRKEETYWRDVGTIASYYEANMDLVEVEPQFNLYDRHWPLRGDTSFAPPAKFVFGDEGQRLGAAVDSIVSPGCILSGGMVRRCVLSPLVRVNSYALVENSILFEGVSVGRHSQIRNAIIEKGVHLPEGTVIGYDLAEDASRFHVTPEGIVVVAASPQESPAFAGLAN
jgi:glucose-1-phosphate adenylyltransferase